MSSTYTDALRLEMQADGENENIWGQIANKQWRLLEQALTGIHEVVVASADVTLVTTNGEFDQARNAILHVTGALSASVNIIIPSQPKIYVVYNDTSGAFDVSIKTSTGAPVVVPQGTLQIVVCDGEDCAMVDGDTTAEDALSLGGVPAANFARKDVGLSTQVFTRAQGVERVTLTADGGGNVALDASLSNCFRLVMTGDFTLSNPSNPYDGQTIRIVVKQDGSGNRVLSYGSQFKFPGGVVPDLSTAAGAVDYLAFEYVGAENIWIGNILKDLG